VSFPVEQPLRCDLLKVISWSGDFKPPCLPSPIPGSGGRQGGRARGLQTQLEPRALPSFFIFYLFYFILFFIFFKSGPGRDSAFFLRVRGGRVGDLGGQVTPPKRSGVFVSPSWGSRRTGHPPEEVGSRTRSGLELFFFFLRESELGISVDRSPPPKRSGFGRVSHPVGTRPLFFCESEGAELGISEDRSPPRRGRVSHPVGTRLVFQRFRVHLRGREFNFRE